jgi:peptidylprolyl isomerase domain and WD repeat-containing protein 1
MARQGDEEEEQDFGPPRPPPGAGDDEDEGDGMIGPAPPRPKKKRKVRRAIEFLRARPPPPYRRRSAAAAQLAPTKQQPNNHQKQQVLPFEQQYLDALPSAMMYERSFMHRDAVTHAACAPPRAAALGAADALVTASSDGVVKFWRKVVAGGGGGGGAGGGGTGSNKGASTTTTTTSPSSDSLAFAKAFRAHLGPVCCLAVSPDGSLAASLSRDRTLKVFDVAAVDLVAMARLPFVPGCAAWAFFGGGGGSGGAGPATTTTTTTRTGPARLVISDLHSGDVYVYDARGGLVSGVAAGGGEDAEGQEEDDGSGAVLLSRAAATPAPNPNSSRNNNPGPAPLQVLRGLHQAPVTAMAYNAAADVMITAGANGYIEYWSPSLPGLPPPTKNRASSGLATTFDLKLDTDLYALARLNTRARSLTVSPDGTQFAAVCADGRVRVWRYASGALRRAYDESADAALARQRLAGELAASAAEKSTEADNNPYLDPSSVVSPLDDLDFGRRLAVERELAAALDAADRASAASASAPDPTSAAVDASRTAPPIPNALFDESGNFLIYGTLLGVKIVNLTTSAAPRLLGKVENTERFVQLALYQGVPGGQRRRGILRVNPDALPSVPASAGPSGGGGGGGGGAADASTTTNENQPDPTLFACAFRRQRFYLFTRREPADAADAAGGRDVFNEKPTADELLAGGAGGTAAAGAGALTAATTTASAGLPCAAVLRTTKGDVRLRLYSDECPRTVENFTTHARNGYYDGVLFHRVIRGFMLQTGDPLGDGTGGESIWGGEFEDEFRAGLRHDKPGTLSMANAGPGTNGSQFVSRR